MVYQSLNAVRGEVCKKRNYHGFVGVDGQIGHSPSCAVFRPESNVVAFLESRLLEEQMKLFDKGGHMTISERLSIQGVQSRFIPIIPRGIL